MTTGGYRDIEPWRLVLKWVLIGTAALIVLVVGFFMLRTFVLTFYVVPSEAMEPNIPSGSRIVVNLLDQSPERGQVIVYRSDEAAGTVGADLVKRVIALENETIEVVGGQVMINGNPLVEPYLYMETVTGDFSPVVVPEGELFVMGDNREVSLDSRFNGPVPVDDVIGTVFNK